MDRREFIKSTAPLGLLAATSGCLGGMLEEDKNKDSDGDGMIDSKDYAPNDPDVQSKDDLAQAAPAGKSTTSIQTTDTSDSSDDSFTWNTTTTTTTTGSVEPNTITVPSKGLTSETHISSYSSEQVTVTINDEDPTVQDIDLSQKSIAVVAAEFPRKSTVGTGVSNSPVGSKQKVTIPMDLSEAPTSTSLHYMAFFIPKGETIQSVDPKDAEEFHETDTFQLDLNEKTVSTTTPLSLMLLSDESDDGYRRDITEGGVQIEILGETNGKDWDIAINLYKSAYAESKQLDHQRSLNQLINDDTSSKFAEDIASLLYSEAIESNFTGKREQVEFIIEFVRSLPHSPTNLDSGYNDTTKLVAETMIELGGDCEDTSVLLASLLQAEPFGYDTVLIDFSDHIGVGIYGHDLGGSYWEDSGRDYYYIESTSVGGEIGEVPSKYDDSKAYVYQI